MGTIRFQYATLGIYNRKRQGIKKMLAQLVTEYRGNYGPVMEAIREPWMKAAKPVKSTGQMDWTTAPVFIVLCGDTRVKVGLPMTVRSDYLKCESIFTSRESCLVARLKKTCLAPVLMVSSFILFSA